MPSGCSTKTLDVHVLPPSTLRSNRTRHPNCGDSMLVGEMISPPPPPSPPPLAPTRAAAPPARSSCTGLFLIGPRMPAGRRLPPVQVRPSSSLDLTMPHHFDGL